MIGVGGLGLLDRCLLPDLGRRHNSPGPRGINYYAVQASGLQHLEATVIHTVLANRPLKVVAAYVATLNQVGPDECPSGGFPVLKAGDLNAKHADFISW
jgi:hypothetical protein